MQKMMTVLIHKRNISVVEFISSLDLYTSVWEKWNCIGFGLSLPFAQGIGVGDGDSEAVQRFHRIGRRGVLIYPGHTSSYQLLACPSLYLRLQGANRIAAVFPFCSCAQNPIRSTNSRWIQVYWLLPLQCWAEQNSEACLGFSKSPRSRVQFFLFSRFMKLSEGSVPSSEKSRKPLPCRPEDELWVLGEV